MKALLAAALLVGATQAQAISVETAAAGDWGNVPLLKFRGDTLKDAVVEKIHSLVASGTCVIPGQSKKKIDMAVPFLVHYGKDGAADRIVIAKLGCAEVESVIGGALVALVDQGAYKATGENPGGWYRHQLSFSYS